jgi:tetratricopeptide (TPR) repeat protein
VGFSAKHVEVVRPKNDLLVQTNHYLTAAMQKLLVVPYPWQRNSHGRRKRLLDLLTAKHGKLTAADAPALLSDCWDVYEDRKRVTGNIVAGINNAQSLAMSPDEDALWLANADYPVCHSERFAGFRLSALLTGRADRYEIQDLPGGAQLGGVEREALQEYAEAWSAHVDQLNDARAVFHLRRAAALAPDETIFPRMAGILLLKQKRFRQALPLLLRNTEYDYKDSLMKAEAHVWVGRCLDLLEQRAEALEHYRKAAALAVTPVSNAAQRHLKKPFKPGQLFDVSPEFICGTAVAKY